MRSFSVLLALLTIEGTIGQASICLDFKNEDDCEQDKYKNVCRWNENSNKCIAKSTPAPVSFPNNAPVPYPTNAPLPSPTNAPTTTSEDAWNFSSFIPLMGNADFLYVLVTCLLAACVSRMYWRRRRFDYEALK